jgi:hypothetical protein
MILHQKTSINKFVLKENTPPHFWSLDFWGNP